MNDDDNPYNTLSRPEPDWARALRWLDTVCGSRGAVLALDAAPLAPEEITLPQTLTAGERQRLESTLTLLDAVAGQFFDDELMAALRRALLLTFERCPGVVTGARSAALLALGVVWAVGHANGLLHPLGSVTQKELREYLAVTQSGSSVGTEVRSALVGPSPWTAVNRPWTYGGYRTRDYEPLGHVGLLVSSTRRQLVAVRDRALSARAVAAA